MRLLPGVALAAVIGVAASVIADWFGTALLGFARSPVSAIPLAVLFGLAVRNSVGVPAVCAPGLQLCVKRLLRAGVVLLGVRLSLADAGATGLVALPVVVACVAAALLLVGALTRALGLPPRLGVLTAVGTSICGVTAIVATAPVIDAGDDETSYAVATIALFGTLALFAYPAVAHALFADQRQAGIFLGTAIHDTSQVAGAGLTYQQQFQAPAALDAAVVTKLVRNLCMVAVIPLVRTLYRRGTPHAAGAAGTPPRGLLARVDAVLPLFVLGFVAMAALRTVGDLTARPFGVVDPGAWRAGIALAQRAAEVALLLAMAAVGLNTDLQRMRVLGLRPLAVGFAAAVCVGTVSVLMIRLLDALAVV